MKSNWRAFGVGAALIMLLMFVADFPSLRGGFVWDDTTLITENRLVKANDGLYRFWFTTEAEDYWPLTSTAWWLEWRVWGDNATAYRVVNLLLHGVNAILVWIILRRLKIPGAWVAALVFAIHPVNVATAAWISEQKNTLSMLFYLTAVLLYLRFDESEGRCWYALSLGTFLLALLSKAAVAMLPVVLLGCVWWRRDRVRWKDLLRSVPFFVLSLVLGLVTVWFQHHPDSAGHPVRDDGFAARLAGAGWAPWFYLSKALLPLNLTMIYPRWKIDASLWVSYVPGIALAGCFMLFWRRRRTWGRPLLFGLGYFVIMLFPVLGFFNQSFFSYRSWLITGSTTQSLESSPWLLLPGRKFAAAWISSVNTWQRCSVWECCWCWEWRPGNGVPSTKRMKRCGGTLWRRTLAVGWHAPTWQKRSGGQVWRWRRTNITNRRCGSSLIMPPHTTTLG